MPRPFTLRRLLREAVTGSPAKPARDSGYAVGGASMSQKHKQWAFLRPIRANRRAAGMGWGILAILLGALAAALFVLGVGVFYGYIPTSLVGNLTATELGVFGVLSIVGAGAVYIVSEKERYYH